MPMTSISITARSAAMETKLRKRKNYANVFIENRTTEACKTAAVCLQINWATSLFILSLDWPLINSVYPELACHVNGIMNGISFLFNLQVISSRMKQTLRRNRSLNVRSVAQNSAVMYRPIIEQYWS